MLIPGKKKWKEEKERDKIESKIAENEWALKWKNKLFLEIECILVISVSNSSIERSNLISKQDSEK